MTPPPEPFKMVFRSFERIEFDPINSEHLFELRGFDLAYASRIFPGRVLERQDTRDYPETRFQVIGDVLGDILFVVYTRRGEACRLITAWLAEAPEREYWYEQSRW